MERLLNSILTKIKFREDSAENWATVNPILASAEPGYEINENGINKWKLGDGVTAWNDLPYQNASGAGLPEIPQITDPFIDVPADGNLYGVIKNIGTDKVTWGKIDLSEIYNKLSDYENRLHKLENNNSMNVVHVTTREEFNNVLYFEPFENVVVVLDNDLRFDETAKGGLYCKTKAALDLNGHNIIFRTNNGDSLFESVQSAITLYEGADLVICGNGFIDGGNADLYCVAVYGGAKLKIQDGTFIGSTHTIYVNQGKAEIINGSYSVIDNFNEDERKGQFLLNLLDANRKNGTASIEVKGGTFINFNPADCLAEGPNTNFVADGYTTIEDNNVFTVVKA